MHFTKSCNTQKGHQVMGLKKKSSKAHSIVIRGGKSTPGVKAWVLQQTNKSNRNSFYREGLEENHLANLTYSHEPHTTT